MEQRRKAAKIRGLETPDLEVGFFFIMIVRLVCQAGCRNAGAVKQRFYVRPNMVTDTESKLRIKMVVSSA